jgi:hypothetical protein
MIQFSKLLHQYTADQLFLHNILWTDEACFSCESVFNVHKVVFLKVQKLVLKPGHTLESKKLYWQWKEASLPVKELK